MERKKNFKFGFTLLILMLILGGCNNDDDEPIVTAQVIISPDEILINDDEQGTIFLSVQPASEFQWNISSKPDWIDITPSSGSINDEIIELEITPNPAGLSQGKHFGEIEILTNGAGKAKSSIQLCVDAHPLVNVDPTEVSFLANESDKTISISNIGTGFLNWELQSLPSWVNVNILSGFLDEGQSIEVLATALRTDLPIGTQTGQAMLTSNSEDGEVAINFTLEVPALAIMSTSISAATFGYFDDTQSFFIRNEGNIPFDWNWDNNANTFLSADINSGTLAVGDAVEVTLTVDRTHLTSQTYDLEIFINNNEGQSVTLPLQIDHFEEQKWLIDGRIIDAEYDKVNDRIIAVSEVPNQIRIFNPVDKSIESLALNLPPTCVSVSQDGDFAVVGHDGSFAYIDLRTMEIIDNYAVTADAFDIVLAPNDWVYVFPREDQWETIRCINLANGVETQHVGRSIRERTKVKLHPSGDFIYGANNGLSPSDFEKYDIRNGTAQYLYDSPYHGDFAFSGNIWISEDGNRLFARSRNVFNASTSQSNDITYNGELVGEGGIKTLDFSVNAKKVYTVFTTGSIWEDIPSNEIRIYETEFLGFQGTIQIPGFLIPDGSGGGNFYDSEGHFGFFNAMGTAYFLLVKVADGAGAQNEWAIATISVE